MSKEYEIHLGDYLKELKPEEFVEAAKEVLERLPCVDEGTLWELARAYQACLNPKAKKRGGSHYTDERDILRVVLPTIIAPYREIYQRIKERPKNILTHDMEDLGELIGFLEQEVVLDPACGSGNFLFVAYREIVQLHSEMMRTWDLWSAQEGGVERRFEGRIDIKNFKGIDIDEFAVELAKLTMTLASELWASGDDHVLPLSNLDGTIVKADSLMAEWPKASRIVGNPPFLGWDRASAILGKDYTHGLKKHFGVSGSPDLCSLFFMKAASEQPVSAGLVATSAIKSNKPSREVALGSVLKAGRIVDAVAQIPWQGDAAVHVSIVNWVSDATERVPVSRYESALPVSFPRITGESVLEEDGKVTRMASIPETLSVAVNVTSARKIPGNPVFRMGRKPGHIGYRFDLTGKDRELLTKSASALMIPHLNGSGLMAATEEAYDGEYLIDVQSEIERRDPSVPTAFHRDAVISEYSLSEVLKSVKDDFDSGKTKAIADWCMALPCGGSWAINMITRSRHTSSCCAEVVDNIDINDATAGFERTGDFYYGIFNSSLHWTWAKALGSRLGETVRYTVSTIDTTFPWTIEDPAIAQTVIDAARNLQTVRKMYRQRGVSLREMARALRTPGTLTLLEDANKRLDDAVLVAYGLPTDASEDDILSHLFELNQSIEGPVFPPNAEEYAGHVWLRGVPVEDLKKSKEEEAIGEQEE